MWKLFSEIFDKQVSSKGLGVFRILFFTNFLLEVIRIFRYRHLYFDTIPYLERSILSSGFIWYVWFALLIMLIIGFKTRTAAVFNYIFIIALIIKNGSYEYHMDYVYAGVGFLSVFIPLDTSYSLNNLWNRLKYSSKNTLHFPKEQVSKFYYFLLFFIGVAVVYFDSAIMKTHSVAWKNGLGLWLPASIPQITIYNNQWFLNQEILVKFLGYFTLVFELVLIFSFWIKKMRVPLLLIGVFFHIGILIEFPIPFFALGVIALYILLIPLKYYTKIENALIFKEKRLIFFYDEECPLCLRTKIIISFLDVFKAIEFKGVQSFGFNEDKLRDFTQTELLDNIYSIDANGVVRSGVDTYFKVFIYIPFLLPLLLFRLPFFYLFSKYIYSVIAKNREVERCTFDNCALPGETNKYINTDEYKIFKNLYIKDLKRLGFFCLFLGLVLLQILSTFNIGILKRMSNKFEVLNTPVECFFEFKDYANRFSHMFFGITNHGVFLDGHYKGFDCIYTLSCDGKLLPLFNEYGQPDRYQKGGVWANYNFRVNGPATEFSSSKLKKGLTRYSAFYLGLNNKNFDKTSFKILKKKIRANFNWEKDLLKKNLATPWIEVGELNWEDKVPMVIKY